MPRAAFDPKPTLVSLPADRWVYLGAVIRATQLSSSCQLVEQRLCLFQIGCVEAFGEPAIDRLEKIAGFGGATLVAAEPRETRSGAQFPKLSFLLLGEGQGFAIEVLGGLGVILPQQ